MGGAKSAGRGGAKSVGKGGAKTAEGAEPREQLASDLKLEFYRMKAALT